MRIKLFQRIFMNECQSRDLMGIPEIMATPKLGRDDVTLIRAAFLSAFNSSFKAELPTINRFQNHRNRYLDEKRISKLFNKKKR